MWTFHLKKENIHLDVKVYVCQTFMAKLKMLNRLSHEMALTFDDIYS